MIPYFIGAPAVYWRFRTRFKKAWWTRVSEESSGWKVAAIALPCRTATGSVPFGCQDFDAFSNVRNLGSADEDHFEEIRRDGLPGSRRNLPSRMELSI